MIISIEDKRHGDFSVLDKDSGLYIKGVQWADDGAGEYIRLVDVYNKDQGKVIERKSVRKTGNIEIRPNWHNYILVEPNDDNTIV